MLVAFVATVAKSTIMEYVQVNVVLLDLLKIMGFVNVQQALLIWTMVFAVIQTKLLAMAFVFKNYNVEKLSWNLV